MAANRFGPPTPPAPGEDHSSCPVCGWRPCTEECRLGLAAWELADLEGLFGCPHDEEDEDDGWFADSGD